VAITHEWRGNFTNAELNALHAEAFETRVYDESEWKWLEQVHYHSLEWVVARDGSDGRLVGFVNVPWDGLSTPGYRTRWSRGAPAVVASASGWWRSRSRKLGRLRRDVNCRGVGLELSSPS
jgi:hypothetical protein